MKTYYFEMTKINKMIYYFRQGENYLLESRTEMAEHTDRQRKQYGLKAENLKTKGANLYKWLVDEIGIDEKYLNELLRNEGI